MSALPCRIVPRWLTLLALAVALWTASPATARDAAPRSGNETAHALPASGDLSVQEAKALLADPPKGLIILDVRTPREFREGHLAGARNLDFFGPGFEREAQALPPDAPVLLYCKSGRRSAAAAEALGETGHRRVLNMSGGMDGWKKAGLPLAK
ncbi:rhodanese-like domain-containing protein [Desulfovibrio sp.]|uniref:rhodanese-like domain-containing protein n=1 Tax=Desulfovibrio sp. TaxID=885 RepID=UPI0023C3C4E3|nr:rhodanese-like domain-containing protein [Desulfovibrio sp.]MDE7240637.1 rhodanese-like domain-containing protein [Desulfovibrio sp.]